MWVSTQPCHCLRDSALSMEDLHDPESSYFCGWPVDRDKLYTFIVGCAQLFAVSSLQRKHQVLRNVWPLRIGRASWRTFGTRKSLITGSQRLATNPPNAILNYCYALLECEARLAAAAMGLDPGLGLLHVDTPNRDSLACDIMEAIRPAVDAWLLDWIMGEAFRRTDFFEEPNGNCRLLKRLTLKLGDTMSAWGKLVAP